MAILFIPTRLAVNFLDCHNANLTVDSNPMKSITFPLLACTLGLATANPAFTAPETAKAKRQPNSAMAPVTDIEGLPRVLLIGDSISIGYTVPVRQLLEGKANVHRPRTNCGPTTRGLEGIEEWLKTGGEGKKWDVIHFNWGLHDIKYMGKDGKNLADPKAEGSHQQVPPAEYEKNLRKLVARLKQTGAKLIWRNTTPVPEGAQGRVVGDAAKYNAIAAKVMEANQIPTDDLFTLSKNHPDLMRPANVHYTPEGSKALAEHVVKEIAKALALVK
jgi:hypothetical protein